MAETTLEKNTGKTADKENFPVGKLIRKELRPLVRAYYNAARTADDIADNPALSAQEKQQLLEQIEADFYGRSPMPEFAAAAELGALFRRENLSASLYTDLLTAFRRDADNPRLQIRQQLLDYCNYSAVPVGRFMLAIHDENPSTYLPAASLCTALQIVNHLQDMKKDALTLDRSYLSDDLLEKHDVCRSDVYLTEETPGLTALKRELTQDCRGMLRDAAYLPRLIRSFRLRAEVGVILSLTNSMLKRIDNVDVLRTYVRLNFRDWLKALAAGLLTACFPRIGR